MEINSTKKTLYGVVGRNHCFVLECSKVHNWCITVFHLPSPVASVGMCVCKKLYNISYTLEKISG